MYHNDIKTHKLITVRKNVFILCNLYKRFHDLRALYITEKQACKNLLKIYIINAGRLVINYLNKRWPISRLMNKPYVVKVTLGV